jgi:hypothetical protein
MFIEYLIVFVVAMLAGMWSTAAGVFMDLDPLAVFLVATAGSLVFATVILIVGGSGRDRLVATYAPDVDEGVTGSRMGSILDRYGVPGIAFASIIFGPGLTLAAVLVLGIDRKQFFLWYAAITVIAYALATGFWVLVAS